LHAWLVKADPRPELLEFLARHRAGPGALGMARMVAPGTGIG
jgi:hypothetical protein